MDFSVKLDPQTIEVLKKQPDIEKKAVIKGLRDGLFFLEARVKERFGTPDNLRVRTGHLRRSITSKVEERGDLIVGIIGSKIIYSAIHEFGGFAGPNRRIYITARPFIGPEITKNEKKIADLIKDRVVKELNK